MSARSLLLSALALLPLSACFDPGHDYAATVTWLINGVAPSEAMCDAYGVDTVRLTTWTRSRRQEVEAPCNRSIELYVDGTYLDYGGFDTTEAFEYGVRYDYRVEMLDRDGNTVVDYEDWFRLHFGDEEPFLLDTLELFQPEGDWASLSGSWTLSGETPDEASCAAAGIDEIAIDVTLVTSFDIDAFFSDPAEDAFATFGDYYEVARAACAGGAVVTDAVLGPGDYYVRYTALDSEGFVIDSYPWTREDPDAEAPYLVDRRGELTLSPAAF